MLYTVANYLLLYHYIYRAYAERKEIVDATPEYTLHQQVSRRTRLSARK